MSTLRYDGTNKQYAGDLRREMVRLFGDKIDIGRWRDKAPQGPHPYPIFRSPLIVMFFPIS